MYQEAQLMYKNNIPDELVKGMLFLTVYSPGTIRETIEIWSLTEKVKNNNEFLSNNGFPIELFIKIDENNYIPFEQIGWFDFGENIDSLSEISLKEINLIINEFDGWLEIDIEDDMPVLVENKVVLKFLTEED